MLHIFQEIQSFLHLVIIDFRRFFRTDIHKGAEEIFHKTVRIQTNIPFLIEK